MSIIHTTAFKCNKTQATRPIGHVLGPLRGKIGVRFLIIWCVWVEVTSKLFFLAYEQL